MISITSAPAAPPPRIRILDPSGGDVETVRIGDRLIFRIEIPGNSKYYYFQLPTVFSPAAVLPWPKILEAPSRSSMMMGTN